MSNEPDTATSRTHTWMVRSRFVEQDYQLTVVLPEGYHGSDKDYPVLYVLDADVLLPTVRDTASGYAVLQDMPDVIVVGIGYGAARVADTFAMRTRDLTPTVDDTWYASVQTFLPTAPQPVGSGGAGRFLAFLREQAIPQVQARYRTDPQDRGLLGASLGGLFALHVLVEAPALFHRLIVASPSIYWDGYVVMRRAQERAGLLRAVPGRLFLSAGEAMLYPSIDELAQLLTTNDGTGLDVRTHVFDCPVHAEAMLVGILRGLRVTYDDLCVGSEALLASAFADVVNTPAATPAR